jgi:hypothetical protein
LSDEVSNIVNNLLDEEPNVFGVALIGSDDQIKLQTENWDLSQDLSNLVGLIKAKSGIGRITLQGINYMVVENTPERKIGTNIKGQGHIIICPTGDYNAALVCYINPQAGPRDALFNVQEYAKKLKGKL